MSRLVVVSLPHDTILTDLGHRGCFHIGYHNLGYYVSHINYKENDLTLGFLQYGFNLVFAHVHAINCIALSLNHRSLR